MLNVFVKTRTHGRVSGASFYSDHARMFFIGEFKKLIAKLLRNNGSFASVEDFVDNKQFYQNNVV